MEHNHIPHLFKLEYLPIIDYYQLFHLTYNIYKITFLTNQIVYTQLSISITIESSHIVLNNNYIYEHKSLTARSPISTAWTLRCAYKHRASWLRHIRCPTIWYRPGNSDRPCREPASKDIHRLVHTFCFTKVSHQNAPATDRPNRPDTNPVRRFRVRHTGKYPEWIRYGRPAGTSFCTDRCSQWVPVPAGIVCEYGCPLKMVNCFCFSRTSCNTDGNVPPSLSRPHPVTVAFSPISKSSRAGKQIGLMCAANSSYGNQSKPDRIIIDMNKCFGR